MATEWQETSAFSSCCTRREEDVIGAAALALEMVMIDRGAVMGNNLGHGIRKIVSAHGPM